MGKSMVSCIFFPLNQSIEDTFSSVGLLWYNQGYRKGQPTKGDKTRMDIYKVGPPNDS